jgi:nucleotide-binding universal stress UspA family protein
MTDLPVLVGVDISVEAIDALRWGLSEGHTTGRGVVIAHVTDGVDADLITSAQVGADAQTLGRTILALYRTIAAQIAPDVGVRTVLLTGDPARSLIAASGDAGLIVLGSRGIAAMGRSALGSVANRVAVHSRCPVVVVPGTSGKTPAGKIVAGLADEPAGRRAVDFASSIANRSDATLVLVRSAPVDARQAAIERVNEQIAELATRYPQLTIQTVLTSQDAAPALTEAGCDADLLVVGCHHSTDPFDARLGSVPAAVLGRVGCPIALVGREQIESS